MTSRLRLAFAVALVLPGFLAPQAWSSGIAVREQSGAGLGNAFAGATAGAEDISYMFFNPAGLTRHNGHRAAAALSFIEPQLDFDSAGASGTLGNTVSGPGGGDAGKSAVIPVFYGLLDLDPKFKAGLGINAPFGLATEYQDGWVGRYYALESEFRTINVNPAIAYKLSQQVSIGVGLQAQYADLKLTNAVDFGTIDQVLLAGAAGGQPGEDDGFSRVDGQSWAFGFNVGLLVELSDQTRFGLAYRSALRHDLEGDAAFSPGGPVGTAVAAATGAFAPTGTRARVDLPETASIGAYHAVNEHWSFMGEAVWTNWSRIDQLRVRFDNPAQSDELAVLDWHDSWFLALGTTYRFDHSTALRFGAAYDQSPTGTANRTARVPDEDRYWLSVGLHYQPWPNVALDIGYAHIFVANAAIELSSAAPGNLFRGDLAGGYDSAIDILTIEFRYRF